MALAGARDALIANEHLHGAAFCRALSDRVDVWLADLFGTIVGSRDDITLMAVGGYGRAELCPYSDLDVLLVHEGVADIADIAGALWYPIWDEGVKLGHSVRTIDEAMELASLDLDTATALLTSRTLAGNTELGRRLTDDAVKSWRRNARRWLPHLEASVAERHHTTGEIAFVLEPDLKQGRGGLRDVQSLRWAFLADRGSGSLEETELVEPYEVMLATRVELHRVTGRSGDRLLLQSQDAVSDALGYGDADLLMADVSAAARRIAWHSDEVWVQLLDTLRRRRPRLRRSPVVVGGPGVTVRDGRVQLEPGTQIGPATVLRLAAAAAHHGARLAPETIGQLEDAVIELPDPWTAEIRELFVDLLKAGHDAIPVIETLDQLDLSVPFLPEWAPNRSRPQRNAYHRFTVDRHLWEATAEAARLVDQVDRADLLLIGTLLHDIGKGYDGDHTEVGMEMIPAIGARMGFDESDTDVLVRMCEHHLLLPDVATRRDLDDDGTIRTVADAAGSLRVLHLLAALTEADSIATGPSAWSAWKAGLVRDLTQRTEFVLDGGDTAELPRNFPSDSDRERMRRGTTGIKGDGNRLEVLVMDRPGVFSRIAGALTLSGLDVLQAAAYTEYGIALAVFRVQNSFDAPIDWDRVCQSVDMAVRGRLALAARIDDRIRTYSRGRTLPQPMSIVEQSVTIDNEASDRATVIEVASQNGIGLLYYVTRALSQLDLDIYNAKIATLGTDVVDSFYVLDRHNQRVTDPDHIEEVRRAILHALHQTFAPERR